MSRTDQPAALCFDMGYTLLHHGYDLGAEVVAMVEAEGLPVDRATLAAGLAEARVRYLAAVRSGRDFEASMAAAVEFWSQENAVLLARLGVPAALHRGMVERIHDRAWSPETWEPFPETIAALTALRQRGWRMAVISNFVDTLHAVCARHGLTPFFETIVCSAEVGMMKPDPRIFQLAARRLGLDAAEVWHVGDSYWADVMGSRAAGMTPVWVDRDRALARPDCLAIRGLDELPSLLDAAVAA